MPSTATLGLSYAIAQNEGFGNPNYKPTQFNNPGDIKASWSPFPADKAGITQFPTLDIGQAALNHQVDLMLSGQSSTYNPNMTLRQAAAIYTSNGPNAGANWAKSLDPTGTIVTQNTTLAQYQALVQSGALTPPTQLQNPNANSGPKPAVTPPPSNAVANTATAVNSADPADRAVTNEIALVDQEIPDATFASLTPDLVITTGLDAVPWFQDPSLLTGNPRIRSFVSPITFKMVIQSKNIPGVNNGYLANPNSGAAIAVQLNASIKTMTKSSKHIYNKTNTRTALHVTMWGQQADLIEAQCSTGIFMNQLGITDFMSTVGISPDLQTLLSRGFSRTLNSDNEVEVSQDVQQLHTDGSDSAFRVAAQDAFVELLSLFKNNGSIYFRKDNYTGTMSTQDQAGVSAWSPQTGVSTQQGNSRNNDVLARGFIAMQLKDSTYLGYFKSLTFNQDAENPFQWNFNFVFQVERTISVLEYPQPR